MTSRIYADNKAILMVAAYVPLHKLDAALMIKINCRWISAITYAQLPKTKAYDLELT